VVNRHTMATKANSFAVTIRPLNGFSRETEKRVHKWLKKQDYAIAVIEMDGTPARHLHAQIWTEKAKTKSSIKTTLQRICKATIPDWNPCQERVLNQGVKFAYNDKFYQEYLLDNHEKEEEVNIIFDNVPSEREGYYPTQAEQDKFKSKVSAVDKKFHHYSELWAEYAEQNGYPVKSPKLWMIHEFYNDALYGSKTITIVRDDKTIRQNIKHLHRYVTCTGLRMDKEMKERRDLWRANYQSNSMPRNTGNNASFM